MKLTLTQRLILYALGHFYQSLNQPLTEKPLQLETSKITFIEHLKKSQTVTKQERALYKNLEMLEKKRLIDYENHMIKFTEFGLQELQKVDKEIKHCNDIEKYFQQAEKPHRKRQTMMKG